MSSFLVFAAMSSLILLASNNFGVDAGVGKLASNLSSLSMLKQLADVMTGKVTWGTDHFDHNCFFAIDLLLGVAVPGIMSALLAMEAFATSYKLVLWGNDAVIVNPSLIGLLDCPSGTMVLPLTFYVELVLVDFALEAYGIDLDRTCWFLWFGYGCWCLYFKDLVEHCTEFFSCHCVCFDCFDPHCCSSGLLGRLVGDICASCSTSGPLVLNCLLGIVGSFSGGGSVLSDNLSSAYACGSNRGALLGDLSSVCTCGSGGAFFINFSSLYACG